MLTPGPASTGALEVGVHDRHVVAERRGVHGGQRAQDAALPGDGRAAQVGRRLDDGVGAEAHADLDDRRRGVDDRHAGALVRLDDPRLGERADAGELDAVVDAEQQRRVVDDVGRDPPAVVGQQRRTSGR